VNNVYIEVSLRRLQDTIKKLLLVKEKHWKSAPIELKNARKDKKKKGNSI